MRTLLVESYKVAPRLASAVKARARWHDDADAAAWQEEWNMSGLVRDFVTRERVGKHTAALPRPMPEDEVPF
jgi:hypothetical protein